MSFITEALLGSSIAPAVRKAVAAGQSWEDGALLVRDANDKWAECGADPAAVGAVALGAYGVNTNGLQTAGGRREFPPGYVLGQPVKDGLLFRARYIGALPAAAGGNYGVVRDSDGLWKVDFNDAANARVNLVHIRHAEAPLNRNLVVVRFLPTVVQVV